MLQLFDPGLDSFIFRFRRTQIIVLPAVRKTFFTLSLFVNCISEAFYPALPQDIRINTALKKYLTDGYSGTMLMIVVSFEFLSKTNSTGRDTFNIMIST